MPDPRALLPLALAALVWQGASALAPGFLPSPVAIASALADLVAGGEIRANLFVSLWRAFAGLALASVVGTLLGLAMARWPAVDAVLSPLVGATWSLPKSALVPLFLLWLGIGSATDILAVFLACLLPVIVHAYHGVKAAPAVLVWSARAMGTPERRILRRILLPAALPAILTGIRIALGFSFVLTVSAEMIASTDGIGKLLFMYGENGAYDYMFAAVAAIVGVAFIADRLLLAARRRLLRWDEPAAEIPA